MATHHPPRTARSFTTAALAVGLAWAPPLAAQDPATALVPNLGQWEHSARFVLHCGPVRVFVEDRGWVVDLGDAAAPRRAALRMTFTGQPGAPRLVGERPQPHRHSYFRGTRARWRTGVPVYASVRFEELYPAIDLRLREVAGHPEYDLLLEPGADLERVEVRVDGGDSLQITPDGALQIGTPLGVLTQPAPVTWQVGADGARQPVACRFVRRGSDRFGFAVDGWNPTFALTIDPGLLWSTLLPGNRAAGLRDAMGLAVGVDDSGVVVVAGMTDEPTFPTTLGAYDATHNGMTDAFVCRLDPGLTGTAQLLDATFLGGSGGDSAIALHAGAAGVVTVAGHTGSADFPTTAGAFDRTHGGRGDVFVAVLDFGLSGASQLRYGTLLGDAGGDICGGLSVDAAGVATVTGHTSSAAFPTTLGAFNREFRGGTAQFPHDAFVTRLDPNRTGEAQLRYSTFFGGTGFEATNAVVVDARGVITLGGETSSTDFPVSAGTWSASHVAGGDGFVVQLDPARPRTAQLVYSTYLGGSGTDIVWQVAVDDAGRPTASGTSSSPEFSTTAGAYDRTHNGGGDVFVCRLDPAATGAAQLVYSTFIGGSGGERVGGMSVDPSGVVTVAGKTPSMNFPTTAGALTTMFRGGPDDGYLLRLDPRKSGAAQLRYATLLGGSDVLEGGGADEILALWVGPTGGATVVGGTSSNDFPTTSGAFATRGVRRTDAFVAQLDLLPTGVSAYGASSPGCRGPIGIGAYSPPGLGNPDFALSCGHTSPGSTGTLALSGASFAPPVAVLGAEVLVDLATAPWFLFPVTADAAGAAEVPLPIPSNPALVGQRLFAQFLWVEPTSPPPCPQFGLATSPALQITMQP